MNGQAQAILWAQLRSIRNYFPKAAKAGVVFGAIVGVFWYGLWSIFAFFAAKILAEVGDPKIAEMLLSGGLLLIFLYWQIIPVLMAATGASLEIKKLRVYPIPHRHLFMLDVLLRITTGIEMLILLTGVGAGLWMNFSSPRWSPLVLLTFVAMNLFLASGAREILARLFARKRVREAAVFLFVLCGALPQLLVHTTGAKHMPAVLKGYNSPFLPWTAAAHLALGEDMARSLAVLVGWAVLSYLFGRNQFERGLRFDADAARSTAVSKPRKASAWSEAFFRWPSRLFPDPLGALVEKEIRFLSRAPRFRLVFTMGFTFGLVIWLPIAYRSGGQAGVMSRNYLTLVCMYALLLLGDVCFWNAFGFDRRAAQTYFVTPVRFGTVLLGKNITAMFFVMLEITAIIVVCSLLRMPVTPARLLEAYSVTLVTSLYLVGVGNLTSTHNPRAVNPEKSMRSSSAGQMQALLVLVYPLASIPVMLAYGARYAFESEKAFYVVLALAALIGAIVYWVATDSAVEAAERDREQIVDRLSQGEGLIQA